MFDGTFGISSAHNTKWFPCAFSWGDGLFGWWLLFRLPAFWKCVWAKKTVGLGWWHHGTPKFPNNCPFHKGVLGFQTIIGWGYPKNGTNGGCTWAHIFRNTVHILAISQSSQPVFWKVAWTLSWCTEIVTLQQLTSTVGNTVRAPLVRSTLTTDIQNMSWHEIRGPPHVFFFGGGKAPTFDVCSCYKKPLPHSKYRTSGGLLMVQKSGDILSWWW